MSRAWLGRSIKLVTLYTSWLLSVTSLFTSSWFTKFPTDTPKIWTPRDLR